MSSTSHETRVERASSGSGFVVFCSCRFAAVAFEPSETEAEKAAAEHKGEAVHTTRVDRAFALGGWVVFCSCGDLTGFADDAAGADKIAADHVAKRECEGHPAGEFDPMGETVYCDGSCR
jgi:hypothetical protein